jgi:hypothetical protein
MAPDLLKISLEIRDMIYKMLLTTPYCTHISPNGDFLHFRLHAGILLANKQISAEAIRVLCYEKPLHRLQDHRALLGSVRLDQKMREPVLNQEPEPEPEPNLEPFPELVRRLVHLVQVLVHRLFNLYRDSSRHTRSIMTFLPNPRIPSWCAALLSCLRPSGEPSAESDQICGNSDCTAVLFHGSSFGSVENGSV